MEQNSFSLFKPDFARIRESLIIVADSIERIATASDEAIVNRDREEAGELWETRELAGRHVFRLGKLTNHGEVELADCDDRTIDTLRAIWESITRLRFGDHCGVPANYRGALSLPGEIGPDLRQRLVDEPYETLSVSQEWGTLATRAIKSVGRLKSFSSSDRELAIHALSGMKTGRTTTTRKRWGSFPSQLRQFAEKLPRNDNPPPALKGSEPSPGPSELPQVNLKTNQVRYRNECLDVTSDGALLMSELVNNHPHPIAASEFLTKPSRTKIELPEALREIIETSPGKGYWLTI